MNDKTNWTPMEILMKWTADQLDSFADDLEETEDLEYAYANGAYEAYKLLAKKLIEIEENTNAKLGL